MIQCQGCQQAVSGVVHYHVSGASVALCARCYAQAWAQRHHPYARITQQLYTLLGVKARRWSL